MYHCGQCGRDNSPTLISHSLPIAQPPPPPPPPAAPATTPSGGGQLDLSGLSALAATLGLAPDAAAAAGGVGFVPMQIDPPPPPPQQQQQQQQQSLDFSSLSALAGALGVAPAPQSSEPVPPQLPALSRQFAVVPVPSSSSSPPSSWRRMSDPTLFHTQDLAQHLQSGAPTIRPTEELLQQVWAMRGGDDVGSDNLR